MQMGLGLSLSRMRAAGGGGGAGSIAMPSSRSANMPAFQQAWNIALDQPAPYTVATITPTAGVPTSYSLIGSQAEGFRVDNVGGNAVVRLWHPEKMLDQGIREQVANMRQRIFTVRATDGVDTADCQVTINLITSTYEAQGRTAIPGLTVRTGRTSTNPLVPAATAFPKTGWSVNTSTKIIQQTANNPAPLVDIDLREYQVIANNVTGGVIEQCLCGPPPGFLAFNHIALVRSQGTGSLTVRNLTFDMQPDTVLTGWDGLGGSFTAGCDSIAILGAQNDAMNPNAGVFTNYYSSSEGVNNRNSSGVILTDVNAWGHQDGIQSFDMTGALSVTSALILAHPRPYKYDAATRQPAGTAAFTSGSATVIGTGTSWQTGSATNRLTVGECIRIAGESNFIVTAVNSDTNITVGNTAASTRSGALIAFPAADARTGVTSPLFYQAISPGGDPLNFDMFAEDMVLIGGGYTVSGGGGAGVKNNLIRARNLSLSDWVFGPVSPNTEQVFSVDLLTDLHTGATITPVKPFPTARSVTTGTITTTTAQLNFTSQDASILYEVRSRTTAGPGAWSGWATIAPGGNASGLVADTGYDYQIRGSNCLSSGGTYLQVATVASGTFTTAASVGYQAETTALLASFTVQPDTAQADATDAFIASLKTAGVWAKLDFLHSYADDDTQRAGRNWKAPGTFDAAVVGAAALNADKRGYRNWGTGNYLTTGGYKSWFTSANLADQDDHSIWFWRANTANANHLAMGNARLALGGRQFNPNAFGRNASTANTVVGSVTRADGLWVNTRSASASYDVWGNATASAPTASSTTLLGTVATVSATQVDSEVIIGAANNGTGTIATNLPLASTAIIAFAGGGAALTSSDIAALNEAIWNYLSALGRL